MAPGAAAGERRLPDRDPADPVGTGRCDVADPRVRDRTPRRDGDHDAVELRVPADPADVSVLSALRRARRFRAGLPVGAMNVAVVLPAHNEAGNLTPLVTELFRAGDTAPMRLEVIVVDDGSVDATAAELAELRQRFDRLHVVTHPVNRGFAPAVRTGIAAARERGCDAAVFMDSDLSHRPDDMPRLVAALEEGADMAIGSRFVPGGGMVGVPAWRAAISRAGNAFGRAVLGMRVRDLTTGYRAARRRVL